MTKVEAVKNVLKIAIGEIGYREKATNSQLDDKTANAGSGNYTKYAKEIDALGNVTWGNKNGYAWCAEYVLWIFYKAFGIDMALKILCSPRPTGIPLCSYGAQYFKDANRWYISNPQPGDVIFFYSGGGINHTGIVESVSGSQVMTIEGNTSDMVARRTYTVGSSYIAGYGRPKYELLADVEIGNGEPVDEDQPQQEQAQTSASQQAAQTTTSNPMIRNGAAGYYVKKAQELLIKAGYNLAKYGADGQFGTETRNAVICFQTANGLSADGIIGPLTWAALEKMSAGTEIVGKAENASANWTPAVGDLVTFTGAVHYTTATGTKCYSCKPGKAKITKVYMVNSAAHPYHLVNCGGRCTVYGWVSRSDFEKV